MRWSPARRRIVVGRNGVGGSGGGVTAFFTDGFESGDFSHTEDGASWTSSDADVTVQSGRGNPGYSMQFRFVGTAPGGDANATREFDLGRLVTELTIKFKLYIPDGTEAWGGAAYAHRNDSPNNNKFFRLWPELYTDRTKVGASLWRSASSPNISHTRSEWDPDGGGVGPLGQTYAPFILESDRGTWIDVKFYCKAATATTNGTLQIYKNGSLVIDNTETVDNYNASYPEGWRYGYLFGAANSGFDSTTYIQMDQVEFYEGAA